MRSTLAALAVLAGLSCAETPPAAPRDDTRYWLGVCAAHGFSQVETAMATGREAPEIAHLQGQVRPSAKPADRLLLLPYPGGRHPRIGFLEAAVDPHRDTKCSVFLPWAGGGYVVVDVPEAVWCDKDLVYLAHTHLPTTWDKQGIRLERLDWTRGDDGTLTSRRILPDGLEFSVRVEATSDGARMELRLKNGTSCRVTKPRAQVCVMLKGAPGFNAQTKENKVKLDASGVCAVRSDDGKRWIGTVFEKPRLWENPHCPCIHSDPFFPDLAPGDEAVSHGRLFVYEGDDFEAEVARRARAGRLLHP
jgi:hypothetical protein